MLDAVKQWIDQVNDVHKKQRVSCIEFVEVFEGYYSPEFLKQAYYVVVDSVPRPDFPELRELGLGDMIDKDVEGVTYNNTYYVLPHVADNLGLHFRELVHVAQWAQLGVVPFMQRYIHEILTLGYEGAPLERMAYALEEQFNKQDKKLDVAGYLSQAM